MKSNIDTSKIGSAQAQHYHAFLDAVKGIDAHKVAKALGKQTPGVIWTDCSKTHMANQYARECASLTKLVMYPGLKRIDLKKLATDAKALKK